MNRINCISSVLFALSLFLLSYQTSFAENTIHIVTEDLPPFQTIEGKKISGVYTDIIRAAADVSDIPYTITMYPWARSYRMAENNINTCIYAIIKTKERENKFKWAGRLDMVDFHFYRLSNRKDISVNNLDDARKYNTVVIRNDLFHEFLKSNGFVKNQNFTVVSNGPEAMRLLHAGGASLIISCSLSLFHRATKAGLEPGAFTPVYTIPELSKESCVAFSLSTPDSIVSRFSDALEAIKKDGTHAAILNKWKKQLKAPSYLCPNTR